MDRELTPGLAVSICLVFRSMSCLSVHVAYAEHLLNSHLNNMVGPQIEQAMSCLIIKKKS